MVLRKSANLLQTSLRKRQRGAEFRKIELMLAKVPQVRTRQVRTSASASARKISTATPVSPHVDPSKDTKEKAFGFRFVDMSILSGIFELLPCKECKECNLELLEDSGKRKGCASYLHLVCQQLHLVSQQENGVFDEICWMWTCCSQEILWANEHATTTKTYPILIAQPRNFEGYENCMYGNNE